MDNFLIFLYMYFSKTYKAASFTGILLLGISFTNAQQSPDDILPVSAQQREAIRAALPEQLKAPVKDERKVIVYSRSMGYYHRSTTHGKAFLEEVQNNTSSNNY